MLEPTNCLTILAPALDNENIDWTSACRMVTRQ
jgi:hypothetical protein